MRFLDSLRFDLRNGWLRSLKLLFTPILLGTLLFFQFYMQWFREADTVGAGDVILSVYGGMQKFVPTVGVDFQFPMAWLLPVLLCSYLVLNYPMDDLTGFGSQVLVRSGVRKGWWMAKCTWCVWTTLYFHGVLLATLYLLSAASGIGREMTLNKVAIFILYQYSEEALAAAPQITAIALVCAVLIFVGLNLVQTTLLLYVKPIVAYLVSAVLAIVAAYIYSPVIPGNFGMLARSSTIYAEGFLPECGLLYGGALIVLALVTGLLRFARYDVIR